MPQHDLRFEKKHGSYYLMDGDVIVYMADTLAIVYDDDVLLKHGPVESVEPWAQRARLRLHGPEFDIKMLTGTDFEIDDLNRLLTHTGSIKELVAKLTKLH